MNADLDALIKDLEGQPLNGTPEEEKQTGELMTQMSETKHDTEALRQRLLELDPPPAPIQVF